ncbi:hypothetical protein [Burkholderia ubonensis]|uniref:hypothetical protein n=1 Tax=Burkholderia ubonensis TaxID=101571 RepID=UPI0012FA78D2|nr:hypothetical protein [Burkholderia ubonensis]
MHFLLTISHELTYSFGNAWSVSARSGGAATDRRIGSGTPNLSDEGQLPVIGLLQAARVRQVRTPRTCAAARIFHRHRDSADAVRSKPVAPTTRA